jgi:flagellar biosynthetic protein FliR
MAMRLDEYVLGAFLVLCRIAACLMLVPGLSTARVPARARLYLAVVLAFLIAPLVDAGAGRGRGAAGDLLPLVLGECAAGALIGLVARLFIEALEFTGTAISHYVGLGSIASSTDGGEPEPSVSTLITMLGILLLMLMDFPQHLVVVLVQSYVDLPLAVVPNPDAMLRQISATLTAAFVMGLKISAPFLVYGIILNAMFAILGKLVPQVSSYFVAVPFMAVGGLALLYFAAGETVHVLTRVLAAFSFRI